MQVSLVCVPGEHHVEGQRQAHLGAGGGKGIHGALLSVSDVSPVGHDPAHHVLLTLVYCRLVLGTGAPTLALLLLCSFATKKEEEKE